jgi:thiamine monophosphate kinase
MLGRRAAIGSSIAVLAVVGGGAALAATHGSSHSTKPTVQKVVRHHVVAKPRVMSGTGVRAGHHCDHSGNAAAQL